MPKVFAGPFAFPVSYLSDSLFAMRKEGESYYLDKYPAGLPIAPGGSLQSIRSVLWSGEGTDSFRPVSFCVSGSRRFILFEQYLPDILSATSIRSFVVDAQTGAIKYDVSRPWGVGSGNGGPWPKQITCSRSELFIWIEWARDEVNFGPSSAYVEVYDFSGGFKRAMSLEQPNTFRRQDWMDYSNDRLYYGIDPRGTTSNPVTRVKSSTTGAVIFETFGSNGALASGSVSRTLLVQWYQGGVLALFTPDGDLWGGLAVGEDPNVLAGAAEVVCLGSSHLYVRYHTSNLLIRMSVYSYRVSQAVGGGQQLVVHLLDDFPLADTDFIMMKTNRASLEPKGQ